MQGSNNYWSRNLYSSRENHWSEKNENQERPTPEYISTWIKPSFFDGSNRISHGSTYISSFLCNDATEPDDDTDYPEYFTSPELKALAESSSNVNSSLTAPSSPLHHSDINSYCSSSSPRISVTDVEQRPFIGTSASRVCHAVVTSSPGAQRGDITLSPETHHVDVTLSPRPHHVDIYSQPRTRHGDVIPRTQYVDLNLSPRQHHTHTDVTLSRIHHSDVSTLPRIHHSDVSTLPRIHHSSVNSSFAPTSPKTHRISYKYDNALYNKYGQRVRWSTPDKYDVSDTEDKKYHSRSYSYYKSNKARFSGSTKSAFTRHNERKKSHFSDSSSHASTSVNRSTRHQKTAKNTASAPAVEKSITNLLSKLFTQGSKEDPKISNLSAHPEKSVKSQKEQEAFHLDGEAKLKNRGSSTESLERKPKDQCRMNMKSSDEPKPRSFDSNSSVGNSASKRERQYEGRHRNDFCKDETSSVKCSVNNKDEISDTPKKATAVKSFVKMSSPLITAQKDVAVSTNRQLKMSTKPKSHVLHSGSETYEISLDSDETAQQLFNYSLKSREKKLPVSGLKPERARISLFSKDSDHNVLSLRTSNLDQENCIVTNDCNSQKLISATPSSDSRAMDDLISVMNVSKEEVLRADFEENKNEEMKCTVLNSCVSSAVSNSELSEINTTNQVSDVKFENSLHLNIFHQKKEEKQHTNVQDVSMVKNLESLELKYKSKAKKSFPYRTKNSEERTMITRKQAASLKAEVKKQKKRHFKGGRYDLYLDALKKKKKKKNSDDQPTSKPDTEDDASESIEIEFENVNNNNSSTNSQAEDLSVDSSKSDSSASIKQYEPIMDLSSVLKMPLKQVLWSKLRQIQNDNKNSEKSLVQNHTYSGEIAKDYSNVIVDYMTDLNECNEDIESESNMENNLKVARDTQNFVLKSSVAEAYANSTRSKTHNLNLTDSFKLKKVIKSCKEIASTINSNVENSDDIEKNTQSYSPCSLNEIGKLCQSSSNIADCKSTLDISKNNENIIESPNTEAIQSDKSDKSDYSFDEDFLSISSDSDDEVIIQKRKKRKVTSASRKIQNHEDCQGHLEVETSAEIPDVEMEHFYSKEIKVPKSSCTCLSKPLGGVSVESSDDSLYCQAVDSIDGQLVGCSNNLSQSNLVRPSAKIPYTAMCEVHLWRLRHHQCCPSCGFFCTQGMFLQCINVNHKTGRHQFHFFHHQCQMALENGHPPVCPHCGNFSSFKSVKLQLNVPNSKLLTCSESRTKEERCDEEENHIIDSISDQDISLKSLSDLELKKLLASDRLSYGPDKLQMQAMLMSLGTEKSVNLRPSGKSFYGPVKTGDVDKVLHLLAMGVDPNHKFENHNNNTPLHAAAAAGWTVIVHILVQAGACLDHMNNNLFTPLMLAVEKKHLPVVQYLVMAGAQLDARGEEGMTCLHLAARGGDVDICKIFLDIGRININVQDDGGWTPLVWSAEHKHLEAVKLLLERGADPNVRDNEQNIALHWAAYSGNADIAQTLLDVGCSLNAVNEHGDSPLHIAAREDNYECVVLFIARGSSTEKRNKENETPIMCIQDKTSQTWMALSMNRELKKWKANENRQHEQVIFRDISRGKETNPIQVVNGIDEEEVPTDFLYVLQNCETSQVNIDTTVTSLQSCQCEDDCTSANCECAILSFKCWYDKESCLLPEFNMLDPPMIFECNRTCRCWQTCANRVVQHGISSRMQLFRTKAKGWGVRTLKDIPKGTFICEYVGEIITDSEADKREDDSYLFDLDNRDGDIYCLDARFYGNISRFINHLCEPNLVPVKVFIDHQDLNFPRIAFFSARDIKAYEELGFDYGEKFWMIKFKWFLCACGSPSCKYSKDTIDDTLERYHNRLREEQFIDMCTES